MISFGPIPSRRLGRSLGINNIPPKSCSYSCVYCQVGPTAQREIEPHAFYSPDSIYSDVAARLHAAERAGESVDYLTFVPDGEPTLDSNLGNAVSFLRPLGVKIAVISNASLLWREDVRERLSDVDWLSVKIDSVDETLWRRINRPHPDLRLPHILDGIREIAKSFRGELVTETMLVDGINDSEASVAAVGEFLEEIGPAASYLAVPIRPVAEPGNQPASEEAVNRACQILGKHVDRVETLIGYEGDAFATTGDVVEDLLSITAVHPMREEAVLKLLAKNGRGRETLERLVSEGRLAVTGYEGKRFYMRRLKPAHD
ncbi:MAG: radical SAM protein [Gammaproteobacteria bacterium]|jgi:wyosine [tRNA(Phe)-imidazoG37] synthetase (radical SAM superfamily)